ncbi:META domain-containing protein [Paracoccus sanguinis]|uniref:META domain-containing protein n=1 Tax=Paracoccus sanguinis TaxID=1545044 RepID=UPI0014519733|nr:META domain-containing protein [Paracoccus sanguinis]QJD16936.1 META domain-containing protein [Paracoccus sanguinis]
MRLTQQLVSHPVVLAPLALAVLAACAGGGVAGGGGAGAGFDGTYTLREIVGVPIAGTADLTIAGQAVSGQGPCNLYHTTNRADWPAVDLAPIATTRRACLIEGGEAAFLAALAQVTRADPVKGGLELAGPARRMIFDAAR